MENRFLKNTTLARQCGGPRAAEENKTAATTTTTAKKQSMFDRTMKKGEHTHFNNNTTDGHQYERVLVTAGKWKQNYEVNNIITVEF